MDPNREFDSNLPQPWTAAQSRAQFAALANLRWHIFRNGFRRKGAGAAPPVRIAMLPILAGANFAVMMLVVLNISPPGLSFDINTIIRFPLSFPRYLTARIFFGLLSASTVIGTLC